MNTVEAINVYERVKDNLNYESGFSAGNYVVENVNNLKSAIDILEELDYLRDDINAIKRENDIYSTISDKITIGAKSHIQLSNFFSAVSAGLKFVKTASEKSRGAIEDDFSIQITLPEDIKDFDDLSKVSSELKKAISIPINDNNILGYTEIITAESGSIILWVLLGTSTAVSVVGRICYSAAVVRKKKAEAALLEEHVKTLQLKNESLEDYKNKQKAMQNAVLQYEAEQIAQKNYNSTEPELIARLRMSITTMQELIDRGTKILPSPQNSNDDIKELFPDYNNLNLIESTMRLLKNDDDNAE